MSFECPSQEQAQDLTEKIMIDHLKSVYEDTQKEETKSVIIPDLEDLKKILNDIVTSPEELRKHLT